MSDIEKRLQAIKLEMQMSASKTSSLTKESLELRSDSDSEDEKLLNESCDMEFETRTTSSIATAKPRQNDNMQVEELRASSSNTTPG